MQMDLEKKLLEFVYDFILFFSGCVTFPLRFPALLQFGTKALQKPWAILGLSRTVVASSKSQAVVYKEILSLTPLTYLAKTRSDVIARPSAHFNWRSWRKCFKRHTTPTCTPGSSWRCGPSSLRLGFRYARATPSQLTPFLFSKCNQKKV